MENREIKFRAWDKENKKMIQLNYLSLQGDTFYTDKHAEGDGKIKEVMQYTGLKDKNGKEIYEGDILKPIDGVMTKNRLVEFLDGSFCYQLRESRRNGGFIALGKQRAGLFEIIGNIYENPELIK